jgi:undecaprenyl phosphate-alpha-L-ara4N flippase subunit ArnE
MTLRLGFILLIVASLLTAVGQICFKKVAVLESSFFSKFLHPVFLLGGLLFVCCPLISSLVAQVMDFSILYAMTSLNFVFVLLLSRWILKEKIDWPKIVGVFVTIIGLLVMVSV